MRRGAFIAVMSISACTAPVKPIDELPETIRLGDQTFAAQMQNGALALRRIGAPLSYSDGLIAKQAGQALCKGRLNPAAFGHFDQGAWLFKGGCV